MQRAIRKALLTAIRNLALYYYTGSIILLLNKKARHRKIDTSKVPLMTFGRLVLRLAPLSGTWDPWRRGRLDTGQIWPDPDTWHRTSLHNYTHCGSVTFCYEYVSADPAPNPAIFVTDLQDVNKKIFIFSTFFCLLVFEATFK
jgi:hypothetical protein